MTLAELITQPVSYEGTKDLALVFSSELAAQLAAVQSEHGNPRHVASPVDLIDGRKMLCADLLTEINEGGLYSSGFSHLPKELFHFVDVIPMSEIIPLLQSEAFNILNG
jgi:hypothetical protein